MNIQEPTSAEIAPPMFASIIHALDSRLSILHSQRRKT